MRYVTEFTTAKPEVAEAHFLARLSVDTDCADVHDSLAYIGDDFVLLHVVGREEDFARRHIPGALHLPHKQMTAERMAEWPNGPTIRYLWCIARGHIVTVQTVRHSNWLDSESRLKSCSAG